MPYQILYFILHLRVTDASVLMNISFAKVTVYIFSPGKCLLF